MKPWFRGCAALALSVALLPAHATGSLSFEGGGHWVDLEVGTGDDARPTLGSVRYHRPGDPKGVRLERCVTKAFDTRRHMLDLRCPGAKATDAAAAVGPLHLTVRGEAAVLSVGGRKIKARFDWAM